VKTIIFAIIVLLGALGSQSLPVMASVLHVSLTGTGVACTSEEPCTVSAAVRQARRGDVILFPPGDFKTPFDTQHPGVTFAGAPNFGTRLLWSSGSTGKHIIGIKHDDTVIMGLVVDGEGRSNSGHGLVRIGSSEGVHILANKVLNSGASLINAGGSWKDSTIRNLKIEGNYLCHSGLDRDYEYGEAIYISDFENTGKTKGVEIFFNEICQFADNGIDLKPPSQDVNIHDNYFHDQVRRPGKEGNQGTLVLQGKGHRVERNLFSNVEGGSSILNVATKANIRIENNVISNARVDLKLEKPAIIRERTVGSGTDTIIENNIFCGLNSKKVEQKPGLVVRDNLGLGTEVPNCTARAELIRETVKRGMAEARARAVVLPQPLPALKAPWATWAELGENVVRVYIQAEGGENPEMQRRTYREGSVRFELVDGSPVPLDREKRAKDDHLPGWVFYLSPPFPRQPIKLIAEEGWITGLPKMELMLPFAGKLPEPEPVPEPDPEPEPRPEPVPVPVPVELEGGQTATCTGRVDVVTMENGTTFVMCLPN